MTEVLSAVLAALAVIGIPLVAWFSRRATREGRLMLRVERLGSVYLLMPESLEKETFEAHLTGAIADLNSWLDPDNAKRRKLIRGINLWAYAIGLAALSIALPSINSGANPWLGSMLGAAIGVVLATVPVAGAYVLERRARKKAAKAAQEREEDEAAARMEALRHGESPPISKPASVVRS